MCVRFRRTPIQGSIPYDCGLRHIARSLFEPSHGAVSYKVGPRGDISLTWAVMVILEYALVIQIY